MPRVVQVPDIRRVDLPAARRAIPLVHAYLRECILDGTLPPGTKLSQPDNWQTAGDVEHAAILEALIAGDEHGALTEMAHHLARTALRVLTDCAPGYVPVAVPHAVALIDRQPPATLRLTGAS